MASTTGMESVFLNVDLSGFPKLEGFVLDYTEELNSGHEPDPSLLTNIFMELVAVAPDDDVLAAALVELETTIVEQVLVRDEDLGNNDGLADLLSFYTVLIDSGYEPSEETQSAIVDNLSDVTSDDPALQDIIDDAVDTVEGETINVVSVNGAINSSASTDIVLSATDDRDVFVFDVEEHLTSPPGAPHYAIDITGFDIQNDVIVFADYDGDGNGTLGNDPENGFFVELLSSDPLIGWTTVPNGSVQNALGFRVINSNSHTVEFFAFNDSDVLVEFGQVPSSFSSVPIEDETSPIVFYADDFIFGEDLIA